MDKKKIIFLVTIILVVGLGLFISSSLTKKSKSSAISSPEKAKVKYWTCGMHPQIKQDKPGNCPICGMNLIPVYEEKAGVVPLAKTEGKRKILYYRNPMNPEITSAVPMKDSMGMDYIPVYAEEEIEEGKGPEVKLTPREIELARVKTEMVRRLPLFKEIRTVGKIAYDPELAITQEEFITALETRDKTIGSNLPEAKESAEELVRKAKFHLRHLGMSEAQIEELEKTRKVQTNLILPEETVWVYAEIYEYELSWVKLGQEVIVTSVAFPGEEFRGRIRAIDPVLNPLTRSVRIRAELDNPELKLKPEMYVDVRILADLGGKEVLAIPRDAVLDTGLRKVVWVDLGEGKFQGREVEVGPEAVFWVEGKRERFYPVIKGLSEGEYVVTQANFLIDSQSQIAGPAEAVYGGALATGEEKEKTPAAHRH
ncbi:MAG: efflux RND transporter periplasmic adaptor subunit [Candidatus Omnitrophica bacterium]|nr:efflux RND transporter periplasmic adaptor subunit [Candidatus Omnitrophota bacterium]